MTKNVGNVKLQMDQEARLKKNYEDFMAIIEKESKKEAVRKKIKAVAKMSLVFKTLREERETINELKQKMGTDSRPPGTLYDGAQGIQKGQKELFAPLPLPLSLILTDFGYVCVSSSRLVAIQGFESAKTADKANEKMPPRKADLDAITTSVNEVNLS